MDCPNCGAYNDSRSFRCRRCDQVLPPDTGEQREESQEETSYEQSWESSSAGGLNWDEYPQSGESRDWESSSTPSGYGVGEPAWSSEQTYRSTPPSEEGSTYAGRPGFGPAPSIPNYLWQSIVVTVCCCLPLGIPAIIFASRVNPFIVSGEYDRARESSNRAKNWALAAFIVGLLWVFCWVGFYALSGTATFNSYEMSG